MLRKLTTIAATLALGMVLVTGAALADSCAGHAKKAETAKAAGCPAKASGKSCCDAFDTKKVTLITGEIVEVAKVECHQNKDSKGVHLTLKTEDGNVKVHLGPSWFLDAQPATFASGDKIEIKGATMTVHGEKTFVAAKVKKGDGVLVLRDAEGNPYWSAWRTDATL
jgi:hypothetical protein